MIIDQLWTCGLSLMFGTTVEVIVPSSQFIFNDLVNFLTRIHTVNLSFAATMLTGKVGKHSFLEEQIQDYPGLGHGEFAYRVRFDWDEEIALPGALIGQHVSIHVYF